jgi:hypothetical protein
MDKDQKKDVSWFLLMVVLSMGLLVLRLLHVARIPWYVIPLPLISGPAGLLIGTGLLVVSIVIVKGAVVVLDLMIRLLTRNEKKD